MQELRERWRETARRAIGSLRHVDRPVAALVAGVLAVATLTTYTSPAPDFSASAAGSATSEGLSPGPTVIADAVAPDLEGLLAAGRDLGSDSIDTFDEPSADARELTPFEGSPVGELGEDEVVPADLIVRSDGVDLDSLTDALAGATHVAPAAALTAQTTLGGDETTDLSLLGVDGSTFRPLAPEVTAAADAVWERFSEGDVLVAHDTAESLGLELGSTLLLRTDSATVPVRIGAFAANGAPSIADVLVPVDVATLLGAAGPNTLIVAAGDDPESLGAALAEATGGELELRRESAPPVAERRTTQATPSGRIEPFSYTSRADGRITIHGDWVARNITRVQLPGMAATSCHRVMVPQLLAVVEELIERDLYSHLDPSQFAGCFVARHIDWNPSRPLSMHAWGLAIDFNTRDNWLGQTPKMDRRVVEVFEKWGFDWGGHWRRPDGMHFELARIVPTG